LEETTMNKTNKTNKTTSVTIEVIKPSGKRLYTVELPPEARAIVGARVAAKPVVAPCSSVLDHEGD
jgi:hypothetical protein